MALSEPMAEASLPDNLARISPGTAIAAIMPMIPTTANSSIRVKPDSERGLAYAPVVPPRDSRDHIHKTNAMIAPCVKWPAFPCTTEG